MIGKKTIWKGNHNPMDRLAKGFSNFGKSLFGIDIKGKQNKGGEV